MRKIISHILLFLFLLIFLSSILVGCGGSRKTKSYEFIVVTNIRDAKDNNQKEGLYCKYCGSIGNSWRPSRFIDTCGKFKVGDTVWPKFTKIQ